MSNSHFNHFNHFRSSSNNNAIRRIQRDMRITVQLAGGDLAGGDLSPASREFLALSALEIVREIERCGPAPVTDGATARVTSVDATELLQTMRARIVLEVSDRGETRFFYVETCPDFCWELPAGVGRSLSSRQADRWVNQHAIDACA